MTNKKKKEKPSKDKPVKTAESTPVVKGKKAVGKFEQRARTKDEKLQAKADEIHNVLMDVKPGPVITKPSGGWVSYLSGKIRFAALAVHKKELSVHSLALNKGKMVCEIIKLTADNKVPVAKIRNRAEAYISRKTNKIK